MRICRILNVNISFNKNLNLGLLCCRRLIDSIDPDIETFVDFNVTHRETFIIIYFKDMFLLRFKDRHVLHSFKSLSLFLICCYGDSYLWMSFCFFNVNLFRAFFFFKILGIRKLTTKTSFSSKHRKEIIPNKKQ